MKLWQLMVCREPGSTGTAEREMLTYIARKVRAEGTKIRYIHKGSAEIAFVITGDDATAESIRDAWKIEFGDPAKDADAPMFGAQRITENTEPRTFARYFNMDEGDCRKMLHEAYGKYVGMGEACVKGIVQGAGGKSSEVTMSKEGIEIHVGKNTCEDAEIARAMHEALLQMLKFIPAGAQDRDKHVETLGKMVDMYLRFRRRLPQD